jgi:hypothetical protein
VEALKNLHLTIVAAAFTWSGVLLGLSLVAAMCLYTLWALLRQFA